MLSAPLDILKDMPLGVVGLGAFLLLVVLLVVWTFVIAPRRARKRLAEFATQGYVEIDLAAPELTSALDSLAPIHLEGPIKSPEGTRRTLNALVRRSGLHPRYVVNVSYVDWVDYSATDQSMTTTWRTVILESRPLPFNTEVSVRLNANERIGVGREERFGFQKVEVPGPSAEFAACCSVYSKSGGSVTLPPRLQQALLDASRGIRTTSRPNTRFSPTGWGISASDVWLDRKALHTLLDAADRISDAL